MSYFGIQPARQRDAQNRVTYVAGAGQTTFAATYTPAYEDVYQNGVKLQRTIDYTALNGTSVIFVVPAALNDVVEINGIVASSPQDVYTKSQADATAGVFYAIAAGTVDALSVTTTPLVPPLYNGMEVRVRVSGPNVSTTPTITFSNLGVAKTISTQGNQVISAGSWATNQEITLRYNVTSDKMEWITGLSPASAAEILAGVLNNKAITPLGFLAQFIGANQSLGAQGYQKLPGGVILQWGNGTWLSGGSTITLPIAYTTTNYKVVTSTETLPVSPLVSTRSAGSFLGSGFATGSGATANCAVSWVTLGY